MLPTTFDPVAQQYRQLKPVLAQVLSEECGPALK